MTCALDDGEFSIDVKNKDGEHVADSLLIPTRRGLKVSVIDIRRSAQLRARIGTQIYELAAQIACQQGRPLVSDVLRSPFAEAFWRKQVRKGRAKCTTKQFPGGHTGGGVYMHPLELHVGKVDTSRLPQPKVRPDGELTWPCAAWELLPGVCQGKVSLEGLRRRRRQR